MKKHSELVPPLSSLLFQNFDSFCPRAWGSVPCFECVAQGSLASRLSCTSRSPRRRRLVDRSLTVQDSGFREFTMQQVTDSEEEDEKKDDKADGDEPKIEEVDEAWPGFAELPTSLLAPRVVCWTGSAARRWHIARAMGSFVTRRRKRRIRRRRPRRSRRPVNIEDSASLSLSHHFPVLRPCGCNRQD